MCGGLTLIGYGQGAKEPLVVLFRMVAAATCYKTCRASVFSGGRELGLASFESFMQNGPFIKTDSGIH